MNKIVAAPIAVVFAVTLVGFGAWPFSNFPASYPGTQESITIGNIHLEYATLIYIAEDQGYFSGNGLNVTIRDYGSGVAAINGVEKKEVDSSVSAEYPIVIEALKNKSISVIGCIDKFQTLYLIGWKDRGIQNTTDIKGKKIGVARRTQAEFYLGRYLDLHDISMQDITLVDIPPSPSAEDLTNGSLDAFVVSYKYLDQIKELLGSNRRNIVIWPVQSGQSGYTVLACRNDWISDHPKTIDKFLRSLDQAEQYSIDHPAEAKAIVQKRLNFTDAYMSEIWPQNQFLLTLDQSLLVAMNDEGRWMIANNLTTVKTLPYFRDYIYTKGLLEVDLKR